MGLEELLSGSGGFWRLIAEGTRDMIDIVDPGGVRRYVSPAYRDFMGYEPGEMLGTNIFDLVHPEDRASVTAAFEQGMRSRVPGLSVTRNRHKDGYYVWLESTGAPLFDDNGESIGAIVISRDVTLRVEADQSLRESEERYRMLFHHSPAGVFYYDTELHLTDCNQRFVTVLQTSMERLMGLDLNVLGDQGVLPAIRRALEGEEGHFEGFYRATTSAVEIWVTMRTAALYDREGNITGGIGIVEDITRRVEAESILRVQRDLALHLAQATSLEEALRLSLQAVLEATGFDGGGVYLVEEETGGLDLACHQGLSEGFVEVISHYDADSPNTRLVMAGDPIYHKYEEIVLSLEEMQLREGLKALAVVPVLHQGKVIGDVNLASRSFAEVPQKAREAVETMAGQIGQAIARVLLDSALRESEERYRAVFEATGTAMCVVDALGHIVFTNLEFLRLSGYRMKEIEAGMPLGDLLADGGAEEAMRCLRELECGQSESHRHLSLRLSCAGGGSREVLASMGLLPGREEAVLSLIDVTREREYERELEERARQLSDFLGIASHELRHPITLIRGYAETMLESWKDGEGGVVEEVVFAIEASSHRLTHLVEELLDVSRIEEGRFPIQRREAGLGSLISEVAEEMRERYSKWEFVVGACEGVPPLPLDPERVRQLLVILLENAANFSSPGPAVEVEVERRGDDALVSVMDRGVGVPEGEQEKIFERFYQVEDLPHHSTPGLGMGLFIAASIVEAHGGRIWHAARSGGGSTFHFTLPLR